MNMPDQKYLYINNNVYSFDSLKQKYVIDTFFSSQKVFMADGGKKTIMGHSCTGYTSTDSSFRIWVTEELPRYINPGISIGTIKGSVIGYRLKRKGVTIDSTIARIEQLNHSR